MLYLTNLPILRTKGILSTISHYNDRVAGSKKRIIANKDLVLLATIAFVRARWREAPPSELRYRPNCNFSPRELQKIFFCTYVVYYKFILKIRV